MSSSASTARSNGNRAPMYGCDAPRVDESLHLVPHAHEGARVLHIHGVHGDAGHGQVAQQQSVGRGSPGWLPPAKPMTTRVPPTRSARSESVMRSPADRVEHDIHAVRARQLLHLIQPRHRPSARRAPHRGRARAGLCRRSTPRRSRESPNSAARSRMAVPTPPAAPCSSTVSPGVRRFERRRTRRSNS